MKFSNMPVKKPASSTLYNLLECPQCFQAFIKNDQYFFLKTHKCKCRTYLEIFGIFIYESQEIPLKKIISSTENRSLSSLFLLWKSKKTFLTVMFLSWIVKKIFSTLPIKHQQKLNNKLFLLSITILSLTKKYRSNFAQYLIDRNYSSSQLIAKKITKQFNANGIIADIGCGAGQLLPVIKSKMKIGMDLSLTNLILASLFFTQPTDLLICADIRKKFPLKTNSIESIIMVETLQYVKPRTCIREISRVASNSGNVQIIHHHKHNQDTTVFGTNPKTMQQMLIKSGFKKVTIVSNPMLWKRLFISHSSTDSIEKTYLQSDIFHYFASKNNQSYFQKFINFEINSKLPDAKKIKFQGEKNLNDKAKLIDLINRFDDFIFLSPHLDDAIFSCGNLLELLKINRKKIHIITFFTKTKITSPLTPQAKLLLKVSGNYSDPQRLFEDRKLEDKNALKLFNASYVHLDYIDACFRTIATSNRPIYKSEKQQYSGNVAKHDMQLIKLIANDTKKLINNFSSQRLILAPMGIGSHADHLIISKIARNLNENVALWADYPYSITEENRRKFFKNVDLTKFDQFTIQKNSQKNNLKVKAIKQYKSQIESQFPKGKLVNDAEVYLLNR